MNTIVMLMLNLSSLLYNNLLKVELRGYDPRTMIEHTLYLKVNVELDTD